MSYYASTLLGRKKSKSKVTHSSSGGSSPKIVCNRDGIILDRYGLSSNIDLLRFTKRFMTKYEFNELCKIGRKKYNKTIYGLSALYLIIIFVVILLIYFH